MRTTSILFTTTSSVCIFLESQTRIFVKSGQSDNLSYLTHTTGEWDGGKSSGYQIDYAISLVSLAILNLYIWVFCIVPPWWEISSTSLDRMNKCVPYAAYLYPESPVFLFVSTLDFLRNTKPTPTVGLPIRECSVSKQYKLCRPFFSLSTILPSTSSSHSSGQH